MKYLFIISLLFSFNTQASINNASGIVARQVAKKLRIVQNAFASQETFNTPLLHQGSDETAYYLKRIRLQYALFAAFDIAVFEVKVIPILEFRWTRKNPKGWVNYRKNI